MCKLKIDNERAINMSNLPVDHGRLACRMFLDTLVDIINGLWKSLESSLTSSEFIQLITELFLKYVNRIKFSIKTV